MNFHPVEPKRLDAALVIGEIVRTSGLPTSVVDFGCNRGEYLAVFKRCGVDDVLGIDGDNMIPVLEIAGGKFLVHDLTIPLDLKRQFDLVLCIEVAEHIDEAHADTLIDTICRHAKGTILFSAATPGQGGHQHINEQRPSYWAKKFATRGWHGSRSIRGLLSDGVSWWLKNNLMTYSKIHR